MTKHARGTMHVTNGDITAELLSQIGIDAMPWRDALHEGPVVRNGRELRAAFLGVGAEEFEARDRALDSHTGEFVLWFEADAVDLGARAWEALIAPNPLAMLDIERSSELRFLREAFIRLAQEYPWTRDGLSLSERRLLAGTPGNQVELFGRASRKEARPFMGDLFAFRIIDRLAPLLDLTEDVYSLNAEGERVLAGEADFVRLCGVDRWIGGVHLHGRDVPWRWDDARETLIAA